MRALDLSQVFPLVNLNLTVGAAESRARGGGEHLCKRRSVLLFCHEVILPRILGCSQGCVPAPSRRWTQPPAPTIGRSEWICKCLRDAASYFASVHPAHRSRFSGRVRESAGCPAASLKKNRRYDLRTNQGETECAGPRVLLRQKENWEC